MIKKITIGAFKSLENVQIELGQVNVFVGANGSGKSNLLEALGILSAAASGRVDDEAIIRRGVRPGLPVLYKSAFPGREHERRPVFIHFCAESENSSYEIRLLNPLSDSSSAWRYYTENWSYHGEAIVGRSHASKAKSLPDAGLAALKVVERKEGDPSLKLLSQLRDYAIYSPDTPTLRGLSPDLQPRPPVGLSGGGLASAINSLLKKRNSVKSKVSKEFASFFELIDWASGIRSVPASSMHLSPSAVTSQRVIRFTDKYMAKKKNKLSGADASEGALYILFAAVLALHESAPDLLAIDNADHGLNPRLARKLVSVLCDSILSNKKKKQMLLTTHNPLVLDGLPLQDERVRLFTVSRTNRGHTTVKRVIVDSNLIKQVERKGSLSSLWTMGNIGGVPNV